jgi:Activator of Hsp90 ATPase homolog 1-like protein
VSDVGGPITHEYTLPCSAGEAVETYAARIGEWWDPRCTANAETLETVVIEPLVDGRVYARHADIGEDDRGAVTVWESGRRLVHTFTLAQDPAHPSEVEVEFVPGGCSGCTMRFAHGGWNEAIAATRQKFSYWPVMLDRFATLVQVLAARIGGTR